MDTPCSSKDTQSFISWPQPERQLEIFHELNEKNKWFKASEIPKNIPNFQPKGHNEIPLLSVYLPEKGNLNGVERTFEELYHNIQVPIGYKKERFRNLDLEKARLKLVTRIEHVPGVRWVILQLNDAYESSIRSPKAIGRLAHAEVLMALIMYPEWFETWNGITVPFINVAGYKCNCTNQGRSTSPHIQYWEEDQTLNFYALNHNANDFSWLAPTVMDCYLVN